MARKFALRIELVPETLWGQNLRSNQVGLGPYRWLALSRAVRAELGRCSICGSTKRLQGHEVWKFREEPRSSVATLVKVNAICTICHSIQHWGRTKMLIAGGLMSVADGRRLIRHFMKINRCARAAFDRHEKRVTDEWLVRSKKRWKIDWGQFKPAVEEAAAARERRHRS
ncbi:hypothetical protein [Afipia sp. GAS231]|uniref:hypothetical protein n=1 Tax=Afipia sp. GAS231 TaxID=1882747 RepID=UPI00087A864A|nr:hypothetical protein [Afipia sp. GAS231]SDP49756.1 hypothetical protein SAMN05444050_7061 [Afipia sp. GAS231]